MTPSSLCDPTIPCLVGSSSSTCRRSCTREVDTFEPCPSGPRSMADAGRSRKRLETSDERRISWLPIWLTESTLRWNSGECTEAVTSDSTNTFTAWSICFAVASSTCIEAPACLVVTAGTAAGGFRTSAWDGASACSEVAAVGVSSVISSLLSFWRSVIGACPRSGKTPDGRHLVSRILVPGRLRERSHTVSVHPIADVRRFRHRRGGDPPCSLQARHGARGQLLRGRVDVDQGIAAPDRGADAGGDGQAGAAVDRVVMPPAAARGCRPAPPASPRA